MNLVDRLKRERETCCHELDKVRAEVNVQIAMRGEGDVSARRAAGREATRLKLDAKAIKQRIAQVDKAIKLFGPIVPSINRRLDIVHYHYDNWLEVSEKGTYSARLVDRWGGDGYINAIKYNAEVIAFLQNMHALCDTLPYIMNLYFRVIDLENRSIGWNGRTFPQLVAAAVQNGEAELADRLTKFSEHPRFVELQSIVNSAKHKHLIPVFYKNSSAYFGELDGEWKASEIDVHQFMLEVDDVLLSEVQDMLRIASEWSSS